MKLECIFKVWGYVPKHKFCASCEPLEHAFRSLGYDKKKTSKAVNHIFKAYAMMNADDVLRDEESRAKRAAAALVKKICSLSVTEKLKRVIEKADRTIRDLEASPVDAEEYVRRVSTIGGRIFQTSTGDEKAFLIGRILSAATTIHDMTKDLERDKQKGLFNPLGNVSQDKTGAITADLKTSLFGDKALLRGSPQTRVFNPQSVLASEGFWETCLGVCTAICSALALYECCCR